MAAGFTAFFAGNIPGNRLVLKLFPFPSAKAKETHKSMHPKTKEIFFIINKRFKLITNFYDRRVSLLAEKAF